MSLYFQPRNIVLNTTAAVAADFVQSNQIAYLQGNRIGRYLDFTPGSTRKEVGIAAETLGVVTNTPTTPLNSTTYGMTLTQVFPASTGIVPEVVTRQISITTPATGVITATTISNQFKNEFFNTGSNPFQVTTNALGAGTVVITAAANYPVIFGAWVNLGGGVAGDVVNNTPGVDTRGLPADLIASGVPAALASGALYTLYALQNNEHTGYNNTMKVNQPEEVFIWLLESMTNYAALVTRLDEWLDSFASGGTAVDPEIIAVDAV